ncbi:alpha-1,2-fucosyltransferase [Dysgonomonas sp. 521]|uniref:alpha-1,2-fucosyltransferase n=1 Tax=Dysgonomonas sp. 521 TaxID=2302932 RepID=UPI0013D0F491|nr:alpha-1,2-fucosyltransferase [Dysgonomonas sp. 521]NDV93713.1 alpha-1,2-fucosyltransferase [Dysgonomonas sp. 521]
MVIVLLSGGLGNQMFQYAAAKSLAMRLNTSVSIDLYAFSKKTQATIRPYELNIFNIENTTQSSSIKAKLVTKGRPFIQKHRAFFQKCGVFTDTYAILYQSAFEKMNGNIIMSGYFQNEKYFKNIKEELRKDFSFKNPLSDKNLETANQISDRQSVAVHIRRGDYLNKSTQSNFIILDKAYYENAISHISERIENPEFFIFSEDFEWIKENLNFGNYPVNFIDWNKGQDSYIDMQLMSLCKHNIIANSSFSWWAAWLNNNTAKIVVAPERWFSDDQKNRLLDNFYPEGWIYKL